MRRSIFLAFGLVLLVDPIRGAEDAVGKAPIPWDLPSLSRPPAVFPAPGFEAAGVRALFYQGLPWKGKPTRVFAWYGAPTAEKGGRIPAMVLVHGGGGTAFDGWVRLWNDRGYAALAMDLCGATPGVKPDERPRHEGGGPPGWGGFDQIDGAIEDQWTYHAVADVALANSLLRSFGEVDPERIGMTGISWGGYLACIVAGIDRRFKLAVPVYGCGFLGDDSCWLDTFKSMGEEKAKKWLRLWDPSRYLPGADLPMLWVTGTNDFAYPLDSLQKSYRLSPGKRTLCVRIRMAHAHGGPGERPEEIRAFADGLLKGDLGLARVTAQGRDGRRVFATYESPSPILRAELCFTKDSGPWQKREWSTAAAEVDSKERKAGAALPEGTKVFYLNLIDERGLAVSTEHVELNPQERE